MSPHLLKNGCNAVTVAVNGMPAGVDNNSFAVANVTLAEGANTITAVATDTFGTASSSVNVTVVNPVTPQLSISASPTSGQSPLDVSFTVDTTIANPVYFSFDCGDGIGGFSAATLEEMKQDVVKYSYTTAGLHYPTFYVLGSDYNWYSKSAVVSVSLPPNLPEKWNGMKAALMAGNIPNAANYISTSTRDSYRQQFQGLADLGMLQEVVSGMGDITIDKTMDNSVAFGNMDSIVDGASVPFFVLFVKDDDGIWRIKSF